MLQKQGVASLKLGRLELLLHSCLVLHSTARRFRCSAIHRNNTEAKEAVAHIIVSMAGYDREATSVTHFEASVVFWEAGSEAAKYVVHPDHSVLYFHALRRLCLIVHWSSCNGPVPITIGTLHSTID
jgi:hypothetical protein